MNRTPTRLAIVVSHPIQYHSPWFRLLAQEPGLQIRVFYLWNFGVTAQIDPGFGHAVTWDLPLLEGYDHAFVPNVSRSPGTHHFLGLDNPELVPALDAWKPDAILLFGYAYLSHLRVVLSPKLRHVPLLFRGDSHDLGRSRGLRSAASRLLRRAVFRRFSAFLAVGKAHAAYLRSSGVEADRIHWAPHCVDNAWFHSQAGEAEVAAAAWRESLGMSEGSPTVLFVGKFEDRKRPMDLLEAFLQVEKTFPDASLLFVGSGAWEEQLQTRAGRLVGIKVFFAPFQNQSRMPIVYASGDVLVLPSMSETWGLVVNEAMNLGLPAIVSSRVGCAPDLVSPGATGWIHEPGDVHGLAECLASFLSMDEASRRRMGQAARAAVQTHDYASATRSLLVTLAEILSSVHPGFPRP